MAKERKFLRLPQELRVEALQMIESGKYTDQAIADYVNRELPKYPDECDFESVDDNTIWRERKHIDNVIAEMKHSQTVAEALASKLDLENLGETGKLLIGMLQGVALKTTTAAIQGDVVDPEMLGDLVLSVSRLQKAANYNADLEKQIRQRLAEEQRQKADEITEELRGADGMSEQLESRIRAILMGKE